MFGDMQQECQSVLWKNPEPGWCLPFPRGCNSSFLVLLLVCSTENCPLLFEGAASWLREGLCGAHVWAVLESAA